MGCGPSQPAYNTGALTETEYKSTFSEEKVLGQGEFGVVKLVTKKDDPASEPYAVKVLNKGFVFKDNTLYTPMKPEVLKMEIEILKVLNGEKYNLVLDSVYESGSKVYVVTEMCAGGEMLEYTSKNMATGLRTEDVSRIAYQLLSAVDHCDKHNILHRDIKPENIMFKENAKSAELRLIDFGCAIMDEEKGKEHATFAGTPFYISPEMFQKKYTTKTDVFSVGVVLYVLVAGYPAQCLQAAFNLLHKAKRDLKSLPGMPSDLSDTYYAMLDKMLTYRWKGRKSAAELLDEDDFVNFHRDLEGKGPKSKRGRMSKTKSVVLLGTGEKAADGFAFEKFQRSVTAILATMMERGDIVSLLARIEAKVTFDDSVGKQLGVISVKDLKKILDSMKAADCVAAIEKQNNAHKYGDYSYEYTLLKPFTKKPDSKDSGYDDTDSSTRSHKASRARFSGLSSRNLSSSTRGMNLSSSNRFKSKRNMNLTKGQSSYIRGI